MRAARPAFFLVSTKKRWFWPDREAFRGFRLPLLARRAPFARGPVSARFAISAGLTITTRLALFAWRRAAFRRSFRTVAIRTLAAFTVGTEAVAPATTTASAIAVETALLLASVLLFAFAVAFAFTARIAFAAGVFLTVELSFVSAGKAVGLGLRRRHGRLHRTHETKIVICVLEIILAQHPVARGRRIARELQIALIDV
jgi:hypothetical protein